MKFYTISKTKLYSKRGASLMLALLLFLVCAVVGSIVLGAATASAGRLDEMAEYDQRYYAVKSAADLLVEKIDSQSFTLERECVTTTTFSEDRKSSETSSSYSVTSGMLPTNRSDLIKDMFLDYAYGENKTASSASSAWAIRFPALSGDITKDISLSTGKDSLNVSITETMDKDGNLSFKIESPDKAYSMTVIFAADTDYQNYSSSSGSEDGSSITTTETKTVSLTWSFTGMK